VGCQNSVRAPRNRRFAGRTLILAVGCTYSIFLEIAKNSMRGRIYAPHAAPVPITKELSQTILGLLNERGIEYVPQPADRRS
jgi:hypothetical protein